MTALELKGLTVSYRGPAGWVEAVRDLSLSIGPGETYGLVGESGSGKSTVAYAALGALAENAAVTAGRILVCGQDVAALDAAGLDRLRGATVAMVHQEPVAALDPVMRIGPQLAEAATAHPRADRSSDRTETRRACLRMLGRVGLPDPEALLRRYPHQLSGGQAQRVVIAMALLAQPRLLVLDEPTTGLDTTVERRVVDLVSELGRDGGQAMLYISHNLGLIARVADRIGVLYAGDLIEEGTARQVLTAPRHPYTRALIAALPRMDGGTGRLHSIPGQIPSAGNRPPGCIFAPRCQHAVTGLCDRAMPPPDHPAPGHMVRCVRQAEIGPAPPRAVAVPATDTPQRDPLLDIVRLGKIYPAAPRRLLAPAAAPVLPALRCVSFAVGRAEIVALVGESGSGKSTLARILVGLDTASDGTARLGNADLAHTVARRRPRAVIRAVQIVFQNPEATLNPAHSVNRILSRALRRLGLRGRHTVSDRITALLDQVRLSPEVLMRRPADLSGGQRQRVAIARALAGTPDIIIADEPVSALDVSVQAAVVNLLGDLRADQGTAILLISHDLALVRHLADRVVVLLGGQVMEAGPAAQVFDAPLHPYTQSLIAAHHPPDPDHAPPPSLPEPDRPMPVAGCPFEPVCPRRLAVCASVPPPERNHAERTTRCHLPEADPAIRSAAMPPTLPGGGHDPAAGTAPGAASDALSLPMTTERS